MIGTYNLIYPNGVDTFPEWENDVDLISASIVNKVQEQMVKMQTVLIDIAPAGISQIMTTREAGGTISAYDLCRLSSVNGDLVQVISNTDDAGSICVAMALESKTSGEDCKFLFHGFVENSSWSWTAKADLYVSNSVLGGLTETPPTVANAPAFSQKVAKAITRKIIYFNPMNPTFFKV